MATNIEPYTWVALSSGLIMGTMACYVIYCLYKGS